VLPDEHPPRIAPIRPSKLLWALVVVAALAFVLSEGWPHLLWNFTYRGDWDHRTYTRCLYVGHHTQTVFPTDGLCPYVRFFKEGADLG